MYQKRSKSGQRYELFRHVKGRGQQYIGSYPTYVESIDYFKYQDCDWFSKLSPKEKRQLVELISSSMARRSIDAQSDINRLRDDLFELKTRLKELGLIENVNQPILNLKEGQ